MQQKELNWAHVHKIDGENWVDLEQRKASEQGCVRQRKLNLGARLIRAPTSFEGLKGQRADRYASWISRDDDHDDDHDVHDESVVVQDREAVSLVALDAYIEAMVSLVRNFLFLSIMLYIRVETRVWRRAVGERGNERERERLKQAEHSYVFLLMLLGVLNLISFR